MGEHIAAIAISRMISCVPDCREIDWFLLTKHVKFSIVFKLGSNEPNMRLSTVHKEPCSRVSVRDKRLMGVINPALLEGFSFLRSPRWTS